MVFSSWCFYGLLTDEDLSLFLFFILAGEI